MPKVLFRRTHPDAKLPTRATPESVGLDVYACERGYLEAGTTCLVRTGWSIEVPKGYEAQVRSRSGLALKKGVLVLNSPGTIDPDYRGELAVILHSANLPQTNLSAPSGNFWWEVGDRIAQLVIAPVTYAEAEEVEELSGTERGEGGFGSTGR
jgi:dUTP pyrophosphatase